jgi:hypothetical protein
VKLLNAKKLCVGDEYLSNVTAGEVLHTRVLQEVTNVFDSACEVDEPFQDCLGNCVHIMIRWKCENVLFEEGDGMRVHQEKGTVLTNVFSTFEWMEEGGSNNTFDGCLSQEFEKKKKFWNVQIRKENMKSIPTDKVRENSTHRKYNSNLNCLI